MLTDLKRLKHLGEGVKIFETTKLIKEEVIEIGEGTQIDDFTLIYGGKGIKFGRYNHIAAFTSVVGGGELITEDYVGIAAGSRIITGTHHYGDGKRISPLVPLEHQEVIIGKIVLKKDVFIGTNAIIYPNVTIGEGAIIGAGGLVSKDIEPWTINVGTPVRAVGKRPKVNVGKE